MGQQKRLHAPLRCSLCALLFLSIGTQGRAQPARPLLLRDPSLSRTQIAFSYAGNIWVANRDGSMLRRLTTEGHEGNPVFSPDGSGIAFLAEYEGSRAVYVVPAAGGRARRLTYHPADFADRTSGMIGWTPDGKRVLFSSGRAAFAPDVVQLFTVSVEGGFPTPLPLIRAAEASFSPDAQQVAYVPNIRSEPEWKRYHGGQTTPIWIANLADSSILAKIPRNDSNDSHPMWIGNTIYFLSDRNGPVTLFSYNVKSKEVKQVVKNDGFDIKSASASSDAIVYEQFGSLHLFDLKAGRDRTLDIQPVADFPDTRPHLQNIADVGQAGPGYLNQKFEPKLSPTGQRIVFAAHGEIFTAPAEKGDIRNMTRTTAFVEREPAWSADGKSLSYFSDESGEYQLQIRDQSGSGEVKKITLSNSPNFYYSPLWSPDSKKIAYTDKHLNYWYVDLEKGQPVRIDTDLFVYPYSSLLLGTQHAWSPDSRWIAYTRQLPNHLHAVFLYSLDQARSYQITDGVSDTLYAAFDPGGRYLYFTASTDIGLHAGWLDMTEMRRPVTRSVYAIVLKDGALSPVADQSDEERPSETQKAEPAVTTGIDIEGIQQRIVRLPLPARNYEGLFAGKAGTLYLLEGPPTVDTFSFELEEPADKVHRFDWNTRKSDVILEDAAYFRLAADGEKMLYAKLDQAKRKQWFIAPAERPKSDEAGRLHLESMSVYTDPRVEWKHMYDQVWRDERDFAYDPGLHGLQLEKVKKEYEPFLDGISSRDDLDYLFREMLANLTLGHIGVSGPDALKPKVNKVGLLGADYSVENGRYRFTRIYSADTWNTESRSPLTEPGRNVRPGEYLLAVDDREIRPSADVYSYFGETAGKQVVLKVGPNADGSGAREVTVVPIADEASLRNFAWLENNRRKVDQLTSGRVGYFYLPDTYAAGFAGFNRDFFAQVGKDALIVEERYGGGGLIADYFIDLLRRPLLSYWHTREGRDLTEPAEAVFGPKVLLINEMQGSGGDAMPWMFRAAGIGPLIGKRTWGGLVGLHTNPLDLLDGGNVTTPNLAFYNPNGTWDIENHGVAPDIEVDDDPKAERAGHDPQLEKAIEVVLDLLKKNPPPSAPQHPPFPNYQSGAR